MVATNIESNMKITLSAWAAKKYDPIPKGSVLARWRREGQIFPAPERVGREWYVEDSARRLVSGAPAVSLVDRLKQREAA